MNADEYLFNLESALQRAIVDFIKNLGTVLVRSSYPVVIDKVNGVNASVISENLKLHDLLSGDPIEVLVEGEISLYQKVENGTQGRVITFWIRPAIVNYNRNKNSFEIIDISKLLTLDFKTGI